MVYVKKDGNESNISTKRPAVRRRATRAARVKLTLHASSSSASRQVSPRASLSAAGAKPPSGTHQWSGQCSRDVVDARRNMMRLLPARDHRLATLSPSFPYTFPLVYCPFLSNHRLYLLLALFLILPLPLHSARRHMTLPHQTCWRSSNLAIP